MTFLPRFRSICTAFLVILGIVIMAQAAFAQLTLIGATERNGSFEDGQLQPWRNANVKASISDGTDPGPVDGSSYVVTEQVTNSDQAQIWGRVHQTNLPSTRADGTQFTLSLSAATGDVAVYDRIVARLLLWQASEPPKLVGNYAFFNELLTTSMETYTGTVTADASGWDHAELRIEFIALESNANATYKAFLDNVLLQQDAPTDG